jgi:pimeloyl-ACP methyl ester carboxylesterase
VPAIADTHRVYRPDLLGCGLSDQPTAGYRYTLETIGAQILAVLDALTLPRVHWVGESSGGLIGLLLAAACPDRFASLMLCNTPSRIPDRIKRIYALDRADAAEAMRVHGVGGVGKRSDTGWTWSARTRRSRTGSCRKSTELRRPSPRRCINVSRASILRESCRPFVPPFCCSAATRARFPRPR